MNDDSGQCICDMCSFNVYVARKSAAAAVVASPAPPQPVDNFSMLGSGPSANGAAGSVTEEEIVLPGLSDAALKRMTSDGYITLDKLEAVSVMDSLCDRAEQC